MQFKLEINLDNAAFQDDLGWELGKCIDYAVSDIGLGLTKGKMRDSNGNTVGQWELDYAN